MMSTPRPQPHSHPEIEEQLADIKKLLTERFANIDQRLESIDGRLDGMERTLEDIQNQMPTGS